MKKNILILITGLLITLTAVFLFLRTHESAWRIVALAGVAIKIYGGAALILQISKKLAKA